MIISFLESSAEYYVNLHAEEVITSNYLNDNNEGIYVSSLQFETINRLYLFLSKKPRTTYLFLDFKNIFHLQPNSIDKIIEIRDLGFSLIFVNVSKEICNSLSVNIISNSYNVKNLKEGFDRFYFFSDSDYESRLESFDSLVLFENVFKEKISRYIVSSNKPHSSSFVYLSSFVDIKRFISLEPNLTYFAIYKLSLKIKRNWNEKLQDKPILVGQSLSSTYVVSIISKLLKLDILIFDKIGPINKIYGKLEKHNFEKKQYIVVSDFVCLGTEVKITKNLIEFSGGKYLGNVSIVKVETLKREHLELKNIDRTISIFSITNENNKELNYFIYTNLSQIHE